MKFYTKQDSKLVFTIKYGSTTENLIYVGETTEDAVEAIKAKGLSWINQIGKSFALVLVTDTYADDRILSNVDICSVSQLSDDCIEVLV